MTKALLDTDILSEYLKGHDQTVANNAARYARQYSVFTFTSVTVYEIVDGLELKAASSQLKSNTEDFRAIQRTGIKLDIENWREAP